MAKDDHHHEKNNASAVAPPNQNSQGGTLSAAKRREQEEPPQPSGSVSWNWANLFTTIFTGGIWVVTTIYAVISYQQWSVMRGALKEARKSNDVAMQVLQTSQRAWVLFDRIDPIMFAAGQPVTTRVDFRNRGLGPGMDVTAVVGGRLVPADLQPPNPEHYLTDVAGQAKSVLGPGEPMALVPKGRRITASELEAIMAGTQRFYVLGFVKYKDQFGERHRTTFCVRYKPSTGLLPFCREYNQAD